MSTRPTVRTSDPPSAFSVTALLAGATKLDPNSLEQSTPTVDAQGYTTFTLQNAGAAYLLPSAQLTYTVPLVDYNGDSLLSINLTDICNMIIWAGLATPPVGTVISAGLVNGGTPIAGRVGVAFGLEYHASGWRAISWRNPGTGWVQGSTPASVSASTRGGIASSNCTSATTQHYIGCNVIDAAGAILPSASLGSSTSGSGSYGPYTHLFVGASWSSASGVNGTEVSVAFRTFMSPIASVADVL